MWFDFENMLTWNIKIWLLFSEFSLPTSYMSESGICHYCFTENARKLLWSRIKSPGIHLSDGLNTPVINFLTSKSSIVLFINGYQSWPIIHPSNPIPCLNPSIPPSHPNPKKRCCGVQMFDNSKVHSFLIFHFPYLLIVQLVDNHSTSFACTLPSVKSFFCSLLSPPLWSV